MYCYSLYGYEENVVLTHDKEFSKKEFVSMCKEAPLLIDKYNGYNSYNFTNIITYLKNTYNFKDLEYMAGFFVDAEVNL